MKKPLVILLCVTLAIGMFIGCSNKNIHSNNGEIDDNRDVQLGELYFEPIDEKALVEDKLKTWFENNYKIEGISAINHNEHVYILLGAGEQSTGGYSVEITSIVGTENEIVVSGKLNSPEEGEMVIQAITYPHVLVKLAIDGRSVRLGSFEKPNKENIVDNNLSLKVIEDYGVYVGQADNNVVEIIVDGIPRGFMISEDIRAYFDINSDLYKGFKENDVVQFSYREDKLKGQMIITNIYKNERIKGEENYITGKYIGQIDSNSIEVEVDNEIGAYRLSEEAKSILQQVTIKAGDIIYLEYKVNEYDEVIIINIKMNL